MLFWFEVSSGLKINLDKSELILVGVVENVKALVAKLGIRLSYWESSFYLFKATPGGPS